MNAKYILIILLMFFGVSCTKEVLNKQPLSMISDNALWNDPALIDAYIINIYSGLPWLLNDCAIEFGYDGNNFYNIGCASELSDEARTSYTWLWPYYWWKTGLLSLSNPGSFDWWGYSDIRKMNVFLEEMQGSAVFNDADKKVRIAQVRFIRAFSYFQLVKLYGGVPLITKGQQITDPDNELYPPRNKEVEIYDFINSELDAVANDLPQSYSAIGMPTKYAALALKSRSAMYAASIAKNGQVKLNGVVGIPSSEAQRFWQASYDAANQIIKSGKYQLYNKYPDNKAKNYRNIFLDENNIEVIFSKQHDGKLSVGHSWDIFESPNGYNAWGIGNNTCPYLEMVEEYEHIDGTPGTLDRALVTSKFWSMKELFANVDPRFDASIYHDGTVWQGDTLRFYKGLILPNGSKITSGSYQGVSAQGKSAPSSETGFGVLKYLDESLKNPTTKESKTDWIIFRYAEVLLNSAEAAYELNKSGDALLAINQIRQRAGIAPLASIDMDKIRHERKVELAFEGHRYFDLRRWRTAEASITRTFTGIRPIYDFSTRKYKIEYIDKVDGYIPLFKPEHYYLPIQNSRTANNPNLVENPGYI